MFREMYLQDPELKKKIEEKARKITENNFNQYKIDIQNKLKKNIPFFVENTTIFEDLEDPEKSTKLVGGLLRFLSKQNIPKTRIVIQTECGCSNWSNYINWDKRQVAYKVLTQVSDDVWKINPVVFEAIKKEPSLYNKIFNN